MKYIILLLLTTFVIGCQNEPDINIPKFISSNPPGGGGQSAFTFKWEYGTLYWDGSYTVDHNCRIYSVTVFTNGTSYVATSNSGTQIASGSVLSGRYITPDAFVPRVNGQEAAPINHIGTTPGETATIVIQTITEDN